MKTLFQARQCQNIEVGIKYHPTCCCSAMLLVSEQNVVAEARNAKSISSSSLLSKIIRSHDNVRGWHYTVSTAH